MADKGMSERMEEKVMIHVENCRVRTGSNPIELLMELAITIDAINHIVSMRCGKAKELMETAIRAGFDPEMSKAREKEEVIRV